MSMDEFRLPRASKSEIEARASAQRKPPAATAQPRAVSRETHSDSGGLFRLSQALAASEADRVEQLRRDFAAGAYQPPAASLSKRVIGEHLGD